MIKLLISLADPEIRLRIDPCVSVDVCFQNILPQFDVDPDNLAHLFLCFAHVALNSKFVAVMFVLS